MKFGIISDLHLDHRYWIHDPDPELFYLIGGDIYESEVARRQWLERFGKNCFWIMGNHDYYKDSFIGADYHLKSIEIGGLKIAGTTLWTAMHPNDWYAYTDYMMDYRLIRDMTYDRYVMTHDIQKKFLFNSNADIWVIHHCPSYKSVHEQYKHSFGNQFFATELAPFIEDMANPPKLIVHGHTHSEFDYMIGTTRVICHPRGYPGERPDYWHYEPKIIEIEK